MSSSWLQRKRKGELYELCERANLPADESLLKDDLVAVLYRHLEDGESTFAKDPTFADFYSRPTRGASPVKRERSSPAEGLTQFPLKTTRRRQTLIKSQLESEERTPEKALVTRTPQHVSRISSRLSQVDIPASPAQLAEVADQSFQAAKTKANELWEKTRFEEFKEIVRENASSVTTIQFLVLLIEASGLQWNTLSTTHVFNSPTTASLNLQSRPVYFPDLTTLLTSDFWAPATLWSLTSWALPLLFSYFFNLTLRTNTKHKTTSRQYTADPLTFNIVRAILAYSVYRIPTISPAVLGEPGVAHAVNLGWGPFAESTVGTVRNNVPGGYHGLQIGAIVGVLYSIYDAALRK
ncbi:hypothetical protein K504DRAFT_467902 [Pleomassaria siparia CBS 279.74]|uniref:Uncharacterized protein n=1 Tax=Pleomassaria siparia CBS 279.74 TaxID=1314801 RepID=A0A6G1K8H4_9PLEO|nr:hypothetical protein K504DRAFT_467902 [Pleomassaria siparia CBS 279.74]